MGKRQTSLPVIPRARSKAPSAIARARVQVSKHLSRRLPYYLTPEEAHRLIDATDTESKPDNRVLDRPNNIMGRASDIR